MHSNLAGQCGLNRPLPGSGSSAGFIVGEWAVFPDVNLIESSDDSRNVETKVMEMLVCLAEQPGELVTKQQILEAVWPDRVVVEGVIKRGISELRKALDDDAHDPRYIETVAGKGYRLVADVRAPEETQSRDEKTPPANTPSLGLHIVGFGLFLSAVVLAVLTAFVWIVSSRDTPPSAAEDTAAQPPLDAMQLYVHGKHLWSSRTPDSIRESIRYFDEALRLDSRFARAYEGKAGAYMILSNYSGFDHREAMREARLHAEAALAIDPNLAEATAMLANITSDNGDQVGALALYKRAVNNDPSSVSALLWYGGFLTMMGYLDEGKSWIKKAQKVEPTSGGVNAVLTLHALIDGDVEAVESLARRTRAVGGVRGEVYLGYLRLSQRRYEDALAAMVFTYEARGRSADHLPYVINALAQPSTLEDAKNRLAVDAGHLTEGHEHLYMEWAILNEPERSLAALLKNRVPLLSAALWSPPMSVTRALPDFYTSFGQHHGYDALWQTKGLPDLCHVTHAGVRCR